jgi:hypothetical protein
MEINEWERGGRSWTGGRNGCILSLSSSSENNNKSNSIPQVMLIEVKRKEQKHQRINWVLQMSTTVFELNCGASLWYSSKNTEVNKSK